MMFDLAQFDSFGPSKFRVGAKHVDCESHLVDHALAGAVMAAEQFEIFKRVVLTVPIFVVYCFFGQKRATKVLGHHVAMFHDSVFSTSHQTGDRNPNVAIAFDVTAVIAFRKFTQCLLTLMFGFASAVAKFLLRVDSATRFAASALFCPTLRAREPLAQHSIFSPPEIRAGNRAVHRVFVEFLLVFTQVRGFVRKITAAFLAGKMNGFHSSNHVLHSLGAGGTMLVERY